MSLSRVVVATLLLAASTCAAQEPTWRGAPVEDWIGGWRRAASEGSEDPTWPTWPPVLAARPDVSRPMLEAMARGDDANLRRHATMALLRSCPLRTDAQLVARLLASPDRLDRELGLRALMDDAWLAIVEPGLVAASQRAGRAMAPAYRDGPGFHLAALRGPEGVDPTPSSSEALISRALLWDGGPPHLLEFRGHACLHPDAMARAILAANAASTAARGRSSSAAPRARSACAPPPCAPSWMAGAGRSARRSRRWPSGPSPIRRSRPS